MNAAADIIRTVDIVLFFLLVGQSFTILVFYWHVWRRTVGKRVGLLPLHVLLVTVLLDGLAAEAVVTNVQHLTQPSLFWTVFNLVAFAVGNYGLWVVLRFEWRRFFPRQPDA